jgi:hypothetical protein
MLRADSPDTTGATTRGTDTAAVATRVLTRRGTIAALTMALGGAAIAAATGLPAGALAAQPDPIFHLIERHREMCRIHAAACLRTEDHAELDAASDAEMDAACDLINSEATTLAGIAALVRYAVEVELPHWEYWPTGLVDDDDPSAAGRRYGRSWWWFLARNLSAVLDRLAVEA